MGTFLGVVSLQRLEFEIGIFEDDMFLKLIVLKTSKLYFCD